MRTARLGAAGFLLTGLAITASIGAAAETVPTCAFNPGTHELTVDASHDGPVTGIRRSGDAITVINEESDTAVPCTGGSPTVTNTDHIQLVGPQILNPYRIELSGGFFGPGVTPEVGGSEIEITVGTATLAFIEGTDAAEAWVYSATPAGDGFDLNPVGSDPDLDIYGPPVARAEFSEIEADLGGGDDAITISGRPLTAVRVSGGPGNDDMLGGPEVSGLFADDGDDFVKGGGGRDWLSDGPGRDTLIGGNGGDLLRMAKDRSKDRALCGKGRDIVVQRKARNRIRSCERRLRRYVDPFTFFSPGFPGPLA